MTDEFIPQMEPWFGEEERLALDEYMRSGGWLTEYRKTIEFEGMVADYVGVRHCIVVNNGTVSLTVAAMAAGVSAGDEVIVPNYTMIASPNSVRIFGALPVFVDVDPRTLCLDYEKTVAAITDRTRAIMLVAANGRCPGVGVNAFRELAASAQIPLIEDAAQALGSRFPDGRHIGSAGMVGSFSFSAPKIISTGQGGCIVTDDDELADRVRKLKDFGRASGGNDIHDSIGFNFKFTELQACVGIEQMRKLPWRVERKREIYSAYRQLLSGNRHVRLFEHDLSITSPWFIDALVDNRDGLVAYLKENGIGSRPMYPPINSQVAYNSPGQFPVSEYVGTHGVWLPSASQLTDAQVRRVCRTIDEFYG